MNEQNHQFLPDEGISTIERLITGFSDLAWGTPLLVLLLGGGFVLVNILRRRMAMPLEGDAVAKE